MFQAVTEPLAIWIYVHLEAAILFERYKVEKNMLPRWDF